MTTRNILIILLVLIAAIGIYFIVRGNDPEAATQPVATTFEECATRYPVMESYPRRCITPEGREFVETIATTTPVAPTAPATPSAPAPSTSGIPNLITVSSPTQGQRITSPITVTGQARGGWYFEASFPVEVRDASGKIIAQGPAQAQGEWMTNEFVPFRSTLTFPAQPAGSRGTVILRKDNPSGDPARDQSVTIPVTF